jgi:flagellar hook assembly protein FlgD
MFNQTDTSKLIKNLIVDQNYPNPFNSFTQIRFLLKFDSKVSLKIYNILGQEVAILIDGELKNGEHRFIWNGKNQNDISLSSGIYFYRLEVSNYSEIKKMMLLR